MNEVGIRALVSVCRAPQGYYEDTSNKLPAPRKVVGIWVY